VPNKTAHDSFNFHGHVSLGGPTYVSLTLECSVVEHGNYSVACGAVSPATEP
jgi:hypothetical protein